MWRRGGRVCAIATPGVDAGPPADAVARGRALSLSTDKPAYTRVEPALVHFGAGDSAPGSGAAGVTAKVDEDPVVDGQKVDLFWFSLGEHALTAGAKGVAGWRTDGRVQFEVFATVYGLEEIIKELDRRGEISHPLALAFCVQARDAALLVDLGLKPAAALQLKALLFEAKLQCENLLITGRAAALLEGDIRYAIDHL